MSAPTVTHIPLTIRVVNAYATGATYTRTLAVTVPAPHLGADLDDWALDNLLGFTGEGPEYASVEAIYEVEVLGASHDFIHLIGLVTGAQG